MVDILRSQGMMVILSSPSGAGKSSLSKALIKNDPNTHLSISATTRSIRPGEIHGKDYHFLDQNDFHSKISNNDFLEYAYVFGNYYGTLSFEVESYLAKSIDVIFDIEWQGARILREKKPNDVISIYILPPSLEVLEERLNMRNQDSALTIERRMHKARDEISHYNEYDYIVINDNFDRALSEIQNIISAERLRRTRLSGIDNFVDNLCK